MSGRVLITGASGFVGANLARRVLRDGHEAHLLLRPGHQSWRLREIAGAFQTWQGDFCDADWVRNVVDAVRPDRVYHLAAYGAYPDQRDFSRMLQTNVLGCRALLDACADFGVEAFVNAGSSSEYGLKNHAPDEAEPAEPNSDYAVAKLAATHCCGLAARKGLNAVTARLYSVYGPYEESSRFIPTLIRRGLAGELPPLVSPDTARDFIHVDDAVDALVRIASTPCPSPIYNVCTGVQTTIGEAVEAARQALRITAEPVWDSMPGRIWDTSVWVGSGARLERELGWRPSLSFAQGLARTIEWFRDIAQ